MRKKLFTILTIVLGTMFMVSCGGDDPKPDPITPDVNEKILGVMTKNYLWALPAEPNIYQATEPFFTSLLHKNDVYTDGGQTYNYSRISPVSSQAGVVYDPGFEYAINNYAINSGGTTVTYYVVLYVKPNTTGAKEHASEFLARGLYITKVNGTAVTAANAATLLPNAYSKGEKVTLSVITPMMTNAKDNIPFVPVANYVEAPLHTAKILPIGSKKVGYIAYHNFSSGTNYAYDNALANKLNEFKNEGVTTLVFDVRYNSGGSVYAVQALGSALVKSRDTNKAFIQQIFRPDLTTPNSPLLLQDKTRGGTSIPTLGDNLDKIYIITGQATAGAPEAFINAIKAYRSTDIVIVGEKSKGRTIATARASENATADNPGASGNWNLTLAYSYLADVNKNYNYASGFTPNTPIQEVQVAAVKKILLGELGTSEEVILSEILKQISGVKSAAAVEARSLGLDREVKTSLSRRPGANETTVDLQ